MAWVKDKYTISSQKERANIDVVHQMLKSSHWAKDRSREDVERSIINSLCFSLLLGEEQIGFARVLTDTMAYAIILDMVIREDFRGLGLGKWLVQCICDHPEVTSLKQVLWTSSAEKFYRKSEFKVMSKLKFMVRNWEL